MWRENLNSDGQEYYQYHQNEHTPVTGIHWA